MRLIIYGAGGIGGVIGAELFKRGHEVLLIARGAHLDAIQRDGLKFASPHETITLPIPAVGHPSEVDFRDDDVVLMTMKAQHTLAALEDLRVAAGEDIPLICGQNGVACEGMALRRFAHVFGMSIYLPSDFLEPGLVLTHAAKLTGILDSGAYPGGMGDPISAVMAMLETSNFSAKPIPDIMRWKYGKLLINLTNGLNAVSPSGDIAKGIRTQMRDEGLACLKAAGIAFAGFDEMTTRRGDLMADGLVDGQARVGSSTLQSLLRGNTDTEVDYLNGEIVKLGRLYGVPVPANLAVLRAANQLARTGAAPQSIPLSELRAAITALGG
jgi:2-dehydropantoate 2-reductase